MKKNRPVDKLYKTIENAQKKVNEIRKNCKHKRSHIGLYSWRIGCIDNARLCNTCDEVLPDPATIFGQAIPFSQKINVGGKDITITSYTTGNSNV